MVCGVRRFRSHRTSSTPTWPSCPSTPSCRRARTSTWVRSIPCTSARSSMAKQWPRQRRPEPMPRACSPRRSQRAAGSAACSFQSRVRYRSQGTDPRAGGLRWRRAASSGSLVRKSRSSGACPRNFRLQGFAQLARPHPARDASRGRTVAQRAHGCAACRNPRELARIRGGRSRRQLLPGRLLGGHRVRAFTLEQWSDWAGDHDCRAGVDLSGTGIAADQGETDSNNDGDNSPATRAPPGAIGTPFYLKTWSDPKVAETLGIPFERMRGPLLAIAGGADEMWPSFIGAERIRRRLTDHGRADLVEVAIYPGAGHSISGVGTGGPLSAFIFHPCGQGVLRHGRVAERQLRGAVRCVGEGTQFPGQGPPAPRSEGIIFSSKPIHFASNGLL